MKRNIKEMQLNEEKASIIKNFFEKEAKENDGIQIDNKMIILYRRFSEDSIVLDLYEDNEYVGSENINAAIHWLLQSSVERKREKEIEETLSRLKKVWFNHPNLRLGQLIQNVFGDIYYIEDEEFVEEIENFYKMITRV